MNLDLESPYVVKLLEAVVHPPLHEWQVRAVNDGKHVFSIR